VVVINGVIRNVFLGNRLNAGRTHMERAEVILWKIKNMSIESLNIGIKEV
jgi:hypothetical protein